MSRRINIVLPEATVETIDRMAKPGQWSWFINQAVQHYVANRPCSACQPWHNKKTHKTYLKPDDGKCLHYYAYFIDPELGLCYVCVPTWCPFRLQVYCNGHRYLARQLTQRQIEYRTSRWKGSILSWTSSPAATVR